MLNKQASRTLSHLTIESCLLSNAEHYSCRMAEAQKRLSEYYHTVRWLLQCVDKEGVGVAHKITSPKITLKFS